MLEDHLNGDILIPSSTPPTNSTNNSNARRMQPLGRSVPKNTISSPTNSERSSNSWNNTPTHESSLDDYHHNSQESEYSQISTGSGNGQYEYSTHNNFRNEHDNETLQTLKQQREGQYYNRHHAGHHSTLSNTTGYRNEGCHNYYDHDQEYAKRQNSRSSTYQRVQGPRQINYYDHNVETKKV